MPTEADERLEIAAEQLIEGCNCDGESSVTVTGQPEQLAASRRGDSPRASVDGHSDAIYLEDALICKCRGCNRMGKLLYLAGTDTQ
jgi:hypothetical protein